METKYAKFNVFNSIQFYNNEPIKPNDETIIVNPTEEQLLENGWYKFTSLDFPKLEDVKPGQEIIEEYAVNEDTKEIVRFYTIMDQPTPLESEQEFENQTLTDTLE